MQIKGKTRALIISLAILALAGGILVFQRFHKTEKKTMAINPVPENTPVAAEQSAEVADKPEAEPEKNNTEKEAETKPETTAAPLKESASPASTTQITNRLVNWGYQAASDRKIDTVIVHSTYNALGGDQFSLAKILDIYKSYGVAPHYIIDRGGHIYRLVADKNIAYHAGASRMPDGRTDVNDFSLGIELINNKTEDPTTAQYAALKGLVGYLKGKYAVKYVLGHNQIAPGRKDDPWNFDWRRLK